MDNLDNCSGETIKHDWYQTDTHVVVSVVLKNMKPENVRVDWTDKTLTCKAKFAEADERCLHIKLAHEINKDDCTWKMQSTKVEIKLKKKEYLRWASLKSEEKIGAFYQKSELTKKDWDKLVFQLKKEEEEEKLEGDAALNQMFQKIYNEGSDETRKAMNKSFLESGGTVLSTNWNEVNEKKVEVKPPDGMEWKQWDS